MPPEVEEWSAETADGRRIFNAGFRMRGDEVRGWRQVKVVPMESLHGEGELAYIWQGGNEAGRELLRLGVAELANWRLAQERLREELGMSMHADIPRGTGSLRRLGDINFVGRDPESDLAAAITFSRGNVWISVRSVGDRTVDVGRVAERLDRALSRPPTQADIAKQRVEARSLDRTARKAGEEQRIIDSLVEDARGGWLKVLASDGELRQEGDTLIHVSAVAGRTRIQVFRRL
jgi:hypothetical protein